MNQSDIISYQLGNQLTDQIVGNNDYLVGASYGSAPGSDGKTSLGMLSILVLGVMAFYVLTHNKQS